MTTGDAKEARSPRRSTPADDLDRWVPRASVLQAQDMVDGQPGRLRRLLAAQLRGTTAFRHGESGADRSFSPHGTASAWLPPLLAAGP
ncbi:hypothetical protein ACWCQQ_47795 [Streptomyces sp. NPDC002143]